MPIVTHWSFRNPDCNFFHTPLGEGLFKTYGHKHFYLAFFRQSQPWPFVPMMEIKIPLHRP